MDNGPNMFASNQQRNQYQNNNYQSQDNYYRNRQGGGGRLHDDACLVFIGGFTPDTEQDVTPILQAIEQKYNVKFANRNPAKVRTKRGVQNPTHGYISPIPTATPEMAQRLIDAKELDIPNYDPYLKITCRKYNVNNRPRGGGGGRYNDDYQQNRSYNKNDDYQYNSSNSYGARRNQPYNNNNNGGNGGYDRNKSYNNNHSGYR